MLAYVTANGKTYRFIGTPDTWGEARFNSEYIAAPISGEWQEVDILELRAKGWLFPPVLSKVDALPVSPCEDDRYLFLL